MAYQSVGTPRFYINVLEWLNSTGATTSSDVFRTLPVNPIAFTDAVFTLQGMTENGFVAVLGHNFGTNGDSYKIQIETSAQSLTEVVNSNVVNGDVVTPQYDGFSISTFYGSDDISSFVVFNGQGSNVGSVIIGNYYDMPHSPDLSLTLTRDYGGIKTIETKGGASLSNAFYTKSADWGSLGAWELKWSPGEGYPDTKLSASGRRIWDLSFSYLDDGDLLGLNTRLDRSVIGGAIGGHIQADHDPGDVNDDIVEGVSGYYTENLLTDDNFYSQVIHRTMGAGNLPFIFQPDNKDNTQFAICKFDMKSFKFSQVAHKLYNVKLKIREVW